MNCNSEPYLINYLSACCVYVYHRKSGGYPYIIFLFWSIHQMSFTPILLVVYHSVFCLYLCCSASPRSSLSTYHSHSLLTIWLPSFTSSIQLMRLTSVSCLFLDLCSLLDLCLALSVPSSWLFLAFCLFDVLGWWFP